MQFARGVLCHALEPPSYASAYRSLEQVGRIVFPFFITLEANFVDHRSHQILVAIPTCHDNF